MPTASGTTTVTTPSDREIRIERTFEAPRDLVWRAFTEPELVARWWGRGHPLDVERDEVYPGGHWRYVEHAPDGETSGFEGRYRDVEPPVRLARTFDWDGMPGHPSVEDAAFAEEDGRTTMTANVSFLTREERDGMMGSGMEQGMNESYAALDSLLASMR